MTAAITTTHAEKHGLALIQDEFVLLEQKMRHVARMGHESLDSAVDMIIQAGGKRLRPAITILTGKMVGASLANMLSVAASVEMLHTATLVHDDLIDGADERRGVPTLHSRLSSGLTVLTGDFLFAQSAALAAEANNVRVVQLFAETLVRICKGEILQAQTRWQIPDYDVYIERIYGKTAALFEAAATSAAILGGISEAQIAALGRYGRQLGLAFQIMDDALDFASTTARLGKPAGHDMRQGIFNLPALFFVEQGHLPADELMARVETDIDGLLVAMRRAHVIEKSLDIARDYARQAEAELDVLPAGIYRDALQSVARYAVAREY